MDYTRIGTVEYEDPSPNAERPWPVTTALYACDRCATVVVDTATHDEWHALVNSRVQMADSPLTSLFFSGELL